MKTRLMLAGMFFLFLVAPLSAQVQSSNRGFMLGAHLAGVSLDVEDAESDGGGGLGIVAGWGFTSNISIYLNVTVAAMEATDDDVDDYALGVGDLGVRYTFGSPEARWRPFLTTGYSAVGITFDEIDFEDELDVDVEMSGPAITVGGGVQFFPTSRLALDGALLFSGGAFDEIRIEDVTVDLEDDDKISLGAFRLQLGLRYYFSKQ